MTIYIVWPYSQFMTFHCKFMTLCFISIIYRMPGFPSPHFSLLCVFLQGPTNTLMPQLSLQVGPSGDNPTPPPCQGSVAFAGSVHFPTFISFLFFFFCIATCKPRTSSRSAPTDEVLRCESRLKGGAVLPVCVGERDAADAAVRGSERGTDFARLWERQLQAGPWVFRWQRAPAWRADEVAFRAGDAAAVCTAQHRRGRCFLPET